ncbi:putative protein OS=Streptomyces microflavus OX=1919 GN=Smic_66150 PE=4 SV=1 [Streptomyces microflavus]
MLGVRQGGTRVPGAGRTVGSQHLTTDLLAEIDGDRAAVTANSRPMGTQEMISPLCFCL